MLVVVLAAFRQHKPSLIRSIKHYTPNEAKKRRQRNVQDRVNHQRKTKKKTKASSEHCIPTETTIEQRKISRRNHKINDNF